jgi:hypothetical protein
LKQVGDQRLECRQIYIYVNFKSPLFPLLRDCMRIKLYCRREALEGDSFRGESITSKSLFDELRETDLLFSHSLSRGRGKSARLSSRTGLKLNFNEKILRSYSIIISFLLGLMIKYKPIGTLLDCTIQNTIANVDKFSILTFSGPPLTSFKNVSSFVK